MALFKFPRGLAVALIAVTFTALSQNLPHGANAIDQKGMRQGKWVILYDDQWKETTSADHAEFYRLISYVDDKPAGVVEDHYRGGKLQFSSKLVADRPKSIYDGQATWYYETGAKRIIVEFDKGTFVRLVGAYLRNGKPAAAEYLAMNDQGNELANADKPAEAERTYAVALENAEAMRSKRSHDYIVIERNLIDVLFAQEKYAKAAAYSQELVALGLTVLPADDPEPVFDISYWSTAAQLAGADENELAKIDQMGVEEGRKRGKPVAYYHMLVSLGTTYKNQGRTAEALSLLEEAWISKKLEDDTLYPLLVYSLAGTYSESRRYSESVAVYREALAVFQRNPETNSVHAQAMAGYMAIDLQASGDLQGALDAFRKELDILRLKGREESFSAAQTLSNIGIICTELGHLVEAEKALLHAETIFDHEAETTLQDRQTLYSGLQTIYQNLGKKDRANHYGEKLIAVGGKVAAGNPADLYTALHDISYHNDRGNLITVRKKLSDLQNAVKRRSNLTQDEQRDYASVLAMSGTLQIRELDSLYNTFGGTASERISRYDGELRKIEKTFRKSLAVQMKADTTVAGKQLQTVTLLQLALVYEKLSVNTDSVVAAVALNALRYFPKAGKQQIELLGYCASLLQLNYHDSKDITDLYRVIFSLLQTYRQQTLPYLSESGQSGYLKTSRYLLDNFISFAVEESGENPELAGFLYDEVLRNKGLILQSLSQTRQLIAEGKDSNLLELFDQWKQLKNELALASGMDEATLKAKKIDISRLQQQSEYAETRLASASAEFRKYKIEQPVSWKEIAAKLKPGEVAVEIVRSVVTDYDRKDSIYAALILRPGSNPALIRIPSANAMEKRMLKAYRNAVRFRSAPGLPDSYGTYWQELAGGLTGAKKVYFSPDGVYHLISIPSLYNTKSKKYLIDEIDVQIVSSTAALLAAQPGKTEVQRGIVLFGSPDFGSGHSNRSQSQDRSMSLDNVMPLPGTEKELGEVARLFESAGVPFRQYISEQATEGQLKSVENPNVLHIATHGYFIQDASSGRPDPDSYQNGSVGSDVRDDPMLRSGLLLAQCCNGSQGDGSRSEDGVLTAYEASTLSLSKTQLVVLSACETGLGEVSFGEGVYGLQRAFLESGASALLMSLWKVDDAATQQLMTDFYREWLTGKAAHESLRAAQQRLRTQYPDPYYWASFVAVVR